MFVLLIQGSNLKVILRCKLKGNETKIYTENQSHLLKEHMILLWSYPYMNMSLLIKV